MSNFSRPCANGGEAPLICLLDKLAKFAFDQSLLNCLHVFFVVRSLLRWWYRRTRKGAEEGTHLSQLEADYLLNSEPELRMFYEYHDMGTGSNSPLCLVCTLFVHTLMSFRTRMAERRGKVITIELVARNSTWYKMASLFRRTSCCIFYSLSGELVNHWPVPSKRCACRESW